MKKQISLKNIGGEVVKEDERYKVIDNKFLNTLVLSKTILNGLKSTTGHSHEGQEEVYMFIEGVGKMQVGTENLHIKEGDVVLIPDGDFHRVWNTSDEKLIFVCVFNGKRYE